MTNQYKSNRREFLKLTGLGGVAAGLSVLGVPGINPIGTAQAAEKTVVIGTWGGDYGQTIQNAIAKPVYKKDDIDLKNLTGSADSRKTKVMVDARAGRSSMDLVCLSDLDMYQISLQHALKSISEEMVPDLSHAFKQFRRPYAVPHIYSAMVIVYNKDKVKKKPTSIRDLWRDEFKGKVGLSDILYKYYIQAIAPAFGGSATNYEPAKEALMELKKNEVSVYPSNEATANALKSGEITATLMWKARAYQWKKAGLPLESSVPSEGALPVIFEIGMTGETKVPEAAATVLSQVLDPQSQIDFAKVMGYVPTVDNADLADDMLQNIGFTDAERDNFLNIDHSYYNNHINGVLTWWNREFKG